MRWRSWLVRSDLFSGRDLDHPHLVPILEHLPNDFSFVQEEGGVRVTLTDNGEEVSYSAMELIAMVLSSAQVRRRRCLVP